MHEGFSVLRWNGKRGCEAENLKAGMRMTKRTGSMNGWLYGMVVALRGRGEL